MKTQQFKPDQQSKPDKQQTRRGKIINVVIGFIIGVLIIPVGQSLLTNAVAIWVEYQAKKYPYKIYIIGDESSESFEFVKKLHEEILSKIKSRNSEYITKLNGVKIEFITKNDAGTDSLAIAGANEIANDPRTLMVIGHFYSTTTKAALPYYLESDPPIPVILITESSPQLMPPNVVPKDQISVIRLVATDKSQAAIAARKCKDNIIHSDNTGKVNAWVIQGDFNPVYSKYLTTLFIREIQNIKNGRGRVLLKTDIDNPPSPNLELSELEKINCIFFAGDLHESLLTIYMIKNFYTSLLIDKPFLIVSDASATSKLIERGKGFVQDAYVISHLPADTISDENKTYNYYAERVLGTIDQILREVEEEINPNPFLKTIRTKAVRNKFLEVINKNIEDGIRLPFSDRIGEEEVEYFLKDTETGIAELYQKTKKIPAPLHIVKVQDSKFIETPLTEKTQKLYELEQSESGTSD